MFICKQCYSRKGLLLFLMCQDKSGQRDEINCTWDNSENTNKLAIQCLLLQRLPSNWKGTNNNNFFLNFSFDYNN